MKKKILPIIRSLTVNILATTALSVLLMSCVGMIQGFHLSGITIPLEMLLVNFLMHIGFFVLNKFELKYYLIKYAVMLALVLGLILGFGYLFNWFEVIAVWIICIVGVLVFLLAIAIDALKLKRDADEINDKLKKIKQRKDEE